MAGQAADDDGKREPETRSGEGRKTRRNPSVVSLAIARTASTPNRASSVKLEELIHGIYKGVLLEEDTLKFWIDKELHENCIMVLAKKLGIEWGTNEEYWGWTTYEDECFDGPVKILEARLKYVSWMHITASLPSRLLSPMTTYEVAYNLMFTHATDGWQYDLVSLGLTLPNGSTQNRMVNFTTIPREQWVEIAVGEFITGSNNIGDIKCNLTETSQYWKRGLVVRGVVFRPK